jgi:diguanylate cyclase (GGDEF)-like protein
MLPARRGVEVRSLAPPRGAPDPLGARWPPGARCSPLKLRPFLAGAGRAFQTVLAMPSPLESRGAPDSARSAEVSAPTSSPAQPDAPVAAPEGLELLRHTARGATARLQALLHGVSAGVLFLGREGRVDLVNRALCRMLGLSSAQELVGQPGATVAHRLCNRFADPAAFERQGFLEGGHELVLADGRVLSRDLVPVGLEGEGHGVLVLLREVRLEPGEVSDEVEPLLTVSLLDELTGLLNRRGFLAQASRRLRKASQEGRPASLFCLDVGGMKTINGRLGHAAGDQALQEAAALLRRLFGEADLVARLGGDKFGVLSLDVTEAQQASLFERLAREVALLNARPARAWRLALAMGGASLDASQSSLVEDLLAVADARLHAVKRARQGKADGAPVGNTG